MPGFARGIWQQIVHAHTYTENCIHEAFHCFKKTKSSKEAWKHPLDLRVAECRRQSFSINKTKIKLRFNTHLLVCDGIGGSGSNFMLKYTYISMDKPYISVYNKRKSLLVFSLS